MSLAFVLVLGIAALSSMILVIAGVSPGGIGDALHATPADGSWKATSFDGFSVRSKHYLLVIRRGQVVGGYDDCNGWSYEDEKPDGNAERGILSTLVECPAGEDLRRLYRILAYAPKIDVVGEDELRLSRDGHEGRFHRCKPDRARSRCVEVG